MGFGSNDNNTGTVHGYLLPIISFADMGRNRIEPIYFQTYPAVSSDTKSATYDSVDIQGRAEPIQVYKNSGSRTISLVLTYVAISEQFDFQWVAQQVNRCRALLSPVYSRSQAPVNTQFRPPPLVLFNFGDRYVNVPCVVSNYSISYSDDEVVQLETMLPMITKITLSLSTSYPYGEVPGHDDIVGGTLNGNPNNGEQATLEMADAQMTTAVSPFDERYFGPATNRQETFFPNHQGGVSAAYTEPNRVMFTAGDGDGD